MRGNGATQPSATAPRPFRGREPSGKSIGEAVIGLIKARAPCGNA